MTGTHALLRHLSCGVLTLVFLTPPGHAQAPPPSSPGAVSFTVLVNGTRVGSQTVSMTQNGAGWLLSSFGSLGPPFNIAAKKLEIAYDADWQPQRMVLQGAVGGRALLLTTTFSAQTATSELVQNGQKAVTTQVVSPRSIVLPDNFFGAYEALAARLASATPGTTLPLYRVPESEVAATVDRVTPRRLVTPEGPVTIREFALSLVTPRGPYPIEIWTDDRQRLARLVLPVSSVVVIRDDLTSVMTREDHSQNPGDEDVFIPANGFSLGATITKAAGSTPSPPVAVLAAGPVNPGRDRLVGGVPLFGRLAGTLADAGYFVVRYDARGSGQSGGRTENAALIAYRDDVLSVIQWLRRRRDVDSDRIVVVGHGDSGSIAMLAAERENRIKGVALMAVPGGTGREAVMNQQQHMLDRLGVAEPERTNRMKLQGSINEAILTGKGWETISTDVRRDADTPWFRSWLLFDPAATLEKVRPPVLIIQGDLDAELSPADADRLETAARSPKRRSAGQTKKVIISGVDRTFIAATAGSIETRAAPASTSPEVGRAIAEWFGGIGPTR